MIKRRVWQRGDHLARRFEGPLLEGLKLPGLTGAEDMEFFHDVDATSPEGKAGCEALGGRNRWAIIAMDGNDIGSQHRRADEDLRQDPQKFAVWLKHMSSALDRCSRGACKEAIQHVIRQWYTNEGSSARPITLPVRPLIVGGDDIVLICHVGYALRFVREACQTFSRLSEEEAVDARRTGIDLWLETGGQLSITAGVLFAPVTLPLATAIPYAEALLASAKYEGRKTARTGKPAEPCVDWESLTEGLIDSPQARRQRELRFFDSDIHQEVELTRRPYTLAALDGVRSLVHRYRTIPGTIRHQVRTGLRAGFWDRKVFTARLGKHQPELVKDLEEEETLRSNGQRWTKTARGRSTDVVDALLLLEEDERMSWITAEIGGAP
jgi:hypothetical protein